MLAPGRLTGAAGPVNARGGKGLCRLVTGLCSWRNSSRNQLTGCQRGGSTEQGARGPEGCSRSSLVCDSVFACVLPFRTLLPFPLVTWWEPSHMSGRCPLDLSRAPCLVGLSPAPMTVPLTTQGWPSLVPPEPALSHLSAGGWEQTWPQASSGSPSAFSTHITGLKNCPDIAGSTRI